MCSQNIYSASFGLIVYNWDFCLLSICIFISTSAKYATFLSLENRKYIFGGLSLQAILQKTLTIRTEPVEDQYENEVIAQYK